MVWYPSVDDIISLNAIVLDLTGDKHPHKLLGLCQGIQSIIDRVKAEEDEGLTYQASLMMKELVNYHPFAGGNHRTAYSTAKIFLLRNGTKLKVIKLETAYLFIKNVGDKDIREIQRWIEDGSLSES